jgi:aspartate kinase
MSGVTDALLNSVQLAANGDASAAKNCLEQHFERHLVVARNLLSDAAPISEAVSNARSELAELLDNVQRQPGSRSLLQDLIVSYGERLSATLLAAVINEAGLAARYVDSRRLIVTNGDHGRAEPLVELTNSRIQTYIEPLLSEWKIPVCGGFIAATLDGTTTTLGRGGSDYTAAIIAAALGACELQIWTDVPGALTADPRMLSEARTIPRLSYAEAAELAFFGAKVLHPKTIQPAVERDIPVRICNARAPEIGGTIVCRQTQISPQSVKAIAHKTGITLVQITSARMLGAHGFLHAIFEIFNRHRTEIDVVTTSEVSVSLSLDDARALPAIVKELQQLGEVHIERQRAIICVVGEGLRGTPGVAARVFGCLTDINVSLISQGASRINLTFVVEEENVREVISRLHDAFSLGLATPVAERVSA